MIRGTMLSSHREYVPSPFQTIQQPRVCALYLWLSMEVVADGYFMSF
jgi:hypothetical protein